MIPVIFLSYKCRDGSVLKSKQELIPRNRPVMVFVWDFDYTESGYDKLELPENVSFIKVPLEGRVRCVQEKRKYIFDYCKANGINDFYLMDDDCKGYKALSHVTEKGVHKYKAVSADKFYDLADAVHIDGAATITFPQTAGSPMAALHEERTNKHAPICSWKVDLAACEKGGIWPDPTPFINEDTDMYIQNPDVTWLYLDLVAEYTCGEFSVLGEPYKIHAVNTLKKWGPAKVYVKKSANGDGWTVIPRRGKLRPDQLKYWEQVKPDYSNVFEIAERFFTETGKKYF